MDSLTSVSPSIVLPLRRHHHYHRRRPAAVPFSCSRSVGGFGTSCDFRGRNRNLRVCSKLGGKEEQEGENQRRDEELERAMRMDGTIPGTSDEFVKQVSSRAYDMRRHLQQSFDSSSYDGKFALMVLKFGVAVLQFYSRSCRSSQLLKMIKSMVMMCNLWFRTSILID